MLTRIFMPLVQFQISMRNAILRFLGRGIKGIDRIVYSWTGRYEHLELDLLGPRPAGTGRWSPTGVFSRLSFPHMSATATAWINVIVAMSVLRTSEALAQTLYFLAPVLYVSTFLVATRLRPRLGGHPVGPWVVGSVKVVGLGFAAFAIFIAAMTILPAVAILAFLWLIAAVLCIVFVPGLGWAIVKADVKWFWSLLTPGKATS